MSTFTIQLNTLIASGFDVGLSAEDYPLFDEGYRAGLNRKILDHYALYEIGQETDEMFKFALNRKMREIMPFYNQMYLSERLEYDPLSTMKYTDDGITTGETTDTSTTDATSASDSSTESRSRSVNSELPQVRLSPNEDYATSANDSTGDSTTTGSGTSGQTSTGGSTAQSDASRTVQGYQGHTALLLMQYRQSMLNIDMSVIAELSPLFMGVWDNGDEFTNGRGYYGYLYRAF